MCCDAHRHDAGATTRGSGLLSATSAFDWLHQGVRTMARHGAVENRRVESRYFFDSGTPIAWRPDHPGRRRCKGWLNDVSDSGLSFITQKSRKPRIGDTVCVHDRRGGPPQLCRVVRTIPRAEGLVLVGCAKDQGMPCPTDCPMHGSPGCKRKSNRDQQRHNHQRLTAQKHSRALARQAA